MNDTAAAPPQSASILVVDDMETNRALIHAILSRAGFERITCVEDGEAALREIATDKFDCVLLDVVMPGISGYEVCRRVRRDPRFAPLPILIQTSQMDREELWEAFESGATDVIRKPFDPRELLARVKVHASNALLSRRMRETQERIGIELTEAEALVGSILPQPETLAKIAEAGVLLDYFIRPSFSVGGDFWTAWPIDRDKVAIFFGDISGHGIAAALRAFALHSLLVPPPPFACDPVHVFKHLNSRLAESARNSFQFVAGMYGVFDRTTQSLTYVAGGLRDALLWSPDGGGRRVSLSGFPLGLIPDYTYTPQTIAINPNDRLVIFSDALIEHFGSANNRPSEDDVFAWVESKVAGNPSDDNLSDRLAAEFFSQSPDCQDDLLIVSATFPDFANPQES